MKVQHLVSNKSRARAVAAGCVALATGGIVLLRAPTTPSAAPHAPEHRVVVTRAQAAPAPRADLAGPGLHGRFALAQGSVLAHGDRQVYAELRVGANNPEVLTADQTPRPVAFAVVLDVSGSMEGEKLEQAKNAVLELVHRMRDTDQISLVTYSDQARVVQPLARLRDVRNRLRTIIPTIRSEGGTQIPAGLSLGASTLNESVAGSVRRVVLVSDGLDGSGTPLPTVSAAVRQRADQGITLSTLGIGTDYDERFLSGVADAGRGNYEFLREGAQLRAFLTREFDQASSTTLERAVAEVTLPAGWRLARAFGTDAEGTTGTVRLPIGALFAGDERRVVLDLTVPAGSPGTSRQLGLTLTYHNVPSGRDVRVEGTRLTLQTAATPAEVLASRDVQTYADAESTALAARQADAVAAWRAGNTAEATDIAQRNIAALNDLQAAAPTAARAAQLQEYQADSQNFGALSAASEDGRAYSLRSNAMNRARMWRSNAASAH